MRPPSHSLPLSPDCRAPLRSQQPWGPPPPRAGPPLVLQTSMPGTVGFRQGLWALGRDGQTGTQRSRREGRWWVVAQRGCGASGSAGFGPSRLQTWRWPGPVPSCAVRSSLANIPLTPETQRDQERRIRREIANSNERRRMQSINAGFQSLKTLIPHTDGEKLSKVRHCGGSPRRQNSLPVMGCWQGCSSGVCVGSGCFCHAPRRGRRGGGWRPIHLGLCQLLRPRFCGRSPGGGAKAAGALRLGRGEGRPDPRASTG